MHFKVLYRRVMLLMSTVYHFKVLYRRVMFLMSTVYHFGITRATASNIIKVFVLPCKYHYLDY